MTARPCEASGLALQLDRDDGLLEQLGAAQHLRLGGNADRPVGEEMLEVVDVFDGVVGQADRTSWFFNPAPWAGPFGST